MTRRAGLFSGLGNVRKQGRAEGRPMTTYTVIYERTERNWGAYVPDLPGCVATGRTRADVERRIRSAIELHLEGM